jgi:hypothetical protein
VPELSAPLRGDAAGHRLEARAKAQAAGLAFMRQRPVSALGSELSRACLVAAIGVATQLRDLATVGWRTVALMIGDAGSLVMPVAAPRVVARAFGA